MANKIIFIGLIVALLQLASAEEANTEPYMNDVSRMSAEIKAAKKRCTQKVSKLEMKLKYLINLQTNSSTLHKHADLACLKTYDLRSAGIHNKTILVPYKVQLVTDDGDRMYCDGVLIEKRFVLANEIASYIKQHKVLEFSFSDEVVSKKIKKVHPILEYDNFDAIALVELASDVDYNYWLYPTCLYTSEIIPRSDLMHDGKTLEIAEDSNCFDTYSKEMSPFEICVYDGCNFNDNIIFVVEEETTPQLFGFKISYCTAGYRKLLKVSPYLDLIENIVWPKNGK